MTRLISCRPVCLSVCLSVYLSTLSLTRQHYRPIETNERVEVVLSWRLPCIYHTHDIIRKFGCHQRLYDRDFPLEVGL